MNQIPDQLDIVCHVAHWFASLQSAMDSADFIHLIDVSNSSKCLAPYFVNSFFFSVYIDNVMTFREYSKLFIEALTQFTPGVDNIVSCG